MRFDPRYLLDPATALNRKAPGTTYTTDLYLGSEGVQYRSYEAAGETVQEVVQIAKDAILITTIAPPSCDIHEQVVSDSDWIHIQFRLNGYGHETVSDMQAVETPTHSCLVTRYPQNSIVKRELKAYDLHYAACLLLNPKALTGLLDTSASALPDRTHWLAVDGQLDFSAERLPINSRMRLAIDEIRACPYRGAARRGYMRAKSLELLSDVIHGVDVQGAARVGQSRPSLSQADINKLTSAAQIIRSRLASNMTLAELAEQVGMSRTKLAVSFKDLHGISVQAFWRNERLLKARQMLASGRERLTDIAFSVGYAEQASFTRAFNRQFGYPPSRYQDTLRRRRKRQ